MEEMETETKIKVEYGLFEDEHGILHIGERRDGELVRAVPAVEGEHESNAKRIRYWLDNAGEIDDLDPGAKAINPYELAKAGDAQAGMNTWRSVSTEWVGEMDMLMWGGSRPSFMRGARGG